MQLKISPTRKAAFNIKKHISKIMLVFSLSFFIIALSIVVYNAGFSYHFEGNQPLYLILLFASAGLFLGLYRIIDILERK